MLAREAARERLGLISASNNRPALTALEALTAAGDQLRKTENRVATGLAVATPQDDGAVWSIAQTMRGQASAWQAVGVGLNRAQSIVDVAASAATSISNLLNSLKAAIVSLDDPTVDAAGQNDLMQTIQTLVDQIDQTAGSASFDNVNLLVPAADPPISLTFPAGGPNPSLSFTTPIPGQPGVVTLDYSLYNVDPATPTLSTTNLSPGGAQLGAPNTAGLTSYGSVSFDYGDWTYLTANAPSSIGFTFNSARFPVPSPGS